MKKLSVYCVHLWMKHGEGVVRCQICRHIWYKFKTKKEPRVVIGYITTQSVADNDDKQE